jgi:transcriptional regulator
MRLTWPKYESNRWPHRAAGQIEFLVTTGGKVLPTRSLGGERYHFIIVGILFTLDLIVVYREELYIQIGIMLKNEVKRGTSEILILALMEEQPRHGYEIAKLIMQRSNGVLQFHVASLYPLLYRLEKRRLINGRWVEKTGERRRRFYSLTRAGQKVLAEQRKTWKDFFAALDRVAKINE